jgi:PilZ domain-containing protein
MIWLITIVIFLGSVVVVLFGFWFLFRRKPEQQRMEARIPARVGLELSGPDQPLHCEMTFTQNVSRHGARVVTKRHWSPGNDVLVRMPEAGQLSRARITYCQALKGNEFAMGLQFSSYDWISARQSAMHSR